MAALFRRYETREELIEELRDWDSLPVDYQDCDLLTLAEAVAEVNDYPYSSERAVSQIFDSEVLPSVLAQYDEDDSIAINEEFTIWTDSLERDGILHPAQISAYCYVGRLAGEG